MKPAFFSGLSFAPRKSLLALVFVMTAACSSSDPSGPSGTGGTSGRGGAGGSAASGGRSGTGGNTPGSGGALGSGGTQPGGTGGSAAGGRGGGSGTDAGAGGTGGTSPDASGDGAQTVDMGNDRPAGDTGDVGTPGATLDSCFAGLRAGRGAVQTGNKASADGKYKTRLALETADRVGTSGTKPWVPFRFAIETPEGVVCVKDEAALVAGYKGSRHNCTDSFEITAEGRRFLITNPEIDPTKPKSKLTIFTGATMTAGPIELTNGACTTNQGGTCTSGGPC